VSAERVIFVLGALGGAALVAIIGLLIDRALGLPADACNFGAGLGTGWFLARQVKDWPSLAGRAQ
jgi:hypothetical protein